MTAKFIKESANRLTARQAREDRETEQAISVQSNRLQALEEENERLKDLLERFITVYNRSTNSIAEDIEGLYRRIRAVNQKADELKHRRQ